MRELKVRVVSFGVCIFVGCGILTFHNFIGYPFFAHGLEYGVQNLYIKNICRHTSLGIRNN